VTTRTVLRPVAAAALSSVSAVFLLGITAAPAFADLRDDGEQSGSGLTVIQTLLIFVGIPAAIYTIITLLVLAPGWARGPRYRPGLGWWAAPVWFNGPDNADAAVQGAAPTPAREGGGASARW
jgi:hypothetical protein